MKIEKGKYQKLVIAGDSDLGNSKSNRGNSNKSGGGDISTHNRSRKIDQTPEFEGGDGVSRGSSSRLSDVLKKDERLGKGGKVHTDSRNIKTKKKLGRDAPKSIKDAWEQRLKAMMNNSNIMNSMPDIARTLLKSWENKTPKIDWKEVLKDYLNKALDQINMVPVNRRAFASKTLMGKRRRVYGFNRDGKNMIDNVVVAIDTSGSISKDQVQIFINEVMGIPEIVKVNNMTIIYMSDAIDGVDHFSPANDENPDLSKYGSTGANAGGFIPPFAYVDRVMDVHPDVFLYMTDGHAEYPNLNQYNIHAYRDRVIWFIVRNSSGFGLGPNGKASDLDYDTIHDMPPFGKILAYSVKEFLGNE